MGCLCLIPDKPESQAEKSLNSAGQEGREGSIRSRHATPPGCMSGQDACLFFLRSCTTGALLGHYWGLLPCHCSLLL